jgi:hypothetical protein
MLASFPKRISLRPQLAVRIEIANVRNLLSEVTEAPDGTAMANLTGSYSAIDKLFSVTAMKVTSPLGAAHLQGSVRTERLRYRSCAAIVDNAHGELLKPSFRSLWISGLIMERPQQINLQWALEIGASHRRSE